MRLLQESRKIGVFGIFGFFGFVFFGFFGFGIFGFLVLVFWLFGSPSRSRGNNYAFLSVQYTSGLSSASELFVSS